MMNSKMFVVALAMAAGTAFAQNSIVNDRPGTFVDISSHASAVGLTNGLTSDDTSYTVTSTVSNAVFASNTVRICTNGFIQFGGAAGAAPWTNATIDTSTTNSPIGTATIQALLPYWDDMRFTAASDDELYWAEGPATDFGLPASRGNVLIIQWNHAGHYDATATTTDFAVGAGTYQVQIFSNIVSGVAAQMIYSDVVWENGAMDSGVSATVGFAAGTTGGPLSLNNVLYSFNTAGSINDGDVLSFLATNTALSAQAAVTPSTFVSPGAAVLYTVNVHPGEEPASTGIMVHADLTAVGGSANAMFHDDGLNGDATAGDNIYSYAYTIPAAHQGGGAHLPVTVTDAQSRTASASIYSNVARDVGTIGSTTVSTTFNFSGPAEIQWIKFNTTADCDPDTNYLDIDTEGSALTGTGTNPNDTEIGLYTAEGTLISADDDSGSGALSQLTFGAIGNPRPAVGNGLAYTGTDGTNGTLVVAGTYYLAVGIFNLNFAANFGVTHTDSGITTGSNGPITVNFNSNLPGGGAQCGAADLGGVGGIPGADNHLDNNDFVVFIDFFFNHNALADQGGIGGTPGADGVWDNNDFVVFIDNFFTAPASCR